jgi:hypothetical protein
MRAFSESFLRWVMDLWTLTAHLIPFFLAQLET